jgi:hypothetical protein
MEPAEKKVVQKLVKRAGKLAIQKGLLKADLPPNVVEGVTDQFAGTYDLLMAGAKLTPEKLTIIFMEKGLGIAKIGSGAHGYQCGIAIAVAAIGLYKAVGALGEAVATEGVLSFLFLLEAADLLDRLYKMDKKCGMSDAVAEKIEVVVTPAYMWYIHGVTEMIGPDLANMSPDWR